MIAKGRKPVGTPANWLDHARSDLRLARLALGQGILPEQICFHAQQAVEKALKAVLLAQGAEFPLTHDLEELLAIIVAAGMAVPTELQEVGALTPYAAETRYPGFWGEITEADLFHALALAQATLAWAEDMTGPT